MSRVYLDNNATTPVLPEVFDAMRPYFSERFGNASSIHHHGQDTRAAVERARDSVASLLNCRASEIIFTSGGTEGDNLAIAGLTRPGDHVITSSIEHHAVLYACKHLEEAGCEVTYLPVDGRGLVDPDDVRRALRSNTKLISIMLANNETGVLQAVAEIGKLAAEQFLLAIEGLDVRVLRLPFVYGDGDPHIAEVIPVMRGFPPTQRMSIGHHADVAQAVRDGLSGQCASYECGLQRFTSQRKLGGEHGGVSTS